MCFLLCDLEQKSCIVSSIYILIIIIFTVGTRSLEHSSFLLLFLLHLQRTALVLLVAVRAEEPNHNLRQVRRPADVPVAVVAGALESVKFNRAPRLAAGVQGRAIKLISQMERHHVVILGVQYQHRLPELGNVLVRFESQFIRVHRLGDRVVEPGQVPV